METHFGSYIHLYLPMQSQKEQIAKNKI